MSNWARLLAAIRMASAAADRGEFDSAIHLLRAVYEERDAPPDGLSLYGLCLALREKKTKQGIEYCRKAIDLQPYDARHRVNLIKIYLLNGSRKKAVEVLEEGMRQLPEDRLLMKMRDEMKYRRRAAIPFLSRNHPLNEMLGKMRRGR
ncbi:MAG TPA: tetratricopeptide repeat protein [Thermoanaerobaculia bacterium]|nr:tetratricopeptide repeat protein [Thermoanaerobaculia bacterium]